MNSSASIDPEPFVRQVQPLLEANDPKALITFLKSHWTCQQITDLLSSSHCDARKVAALALSLVGTRCCVEGLSKQLRDPDPVVNQMAEHALWSIWFRLGTPEANQHVHRGTLALGTKDYHQAIEHFDQAVQIDPTFAEAFNQRALAYCLLEEFESSIRDCRKTVELMPCHFNAWAGMGHAYTQQGRLPDARRCYQKALSINPHLSEIRQAMQELEAAVER